MTHGWMGIGQEDIIGNFDRTGNDKKLVLGLEWEMKHGGQGWDVREGGLLAGKGPGEMAR